MRSRKTRKTAVSFAMIVLNNLHHFFFYLLILFLPTQLGKHFWPDWTIAQGIRIDYLSPVIYFTDLLALGVLVSWGVSAALKFKVQSSKFITTQSLKIILVSLSFFAFNIFFSQNKPAAFFKFLKLVELFLLGVYVKKNLTTSEKNTSKVSAAVPRTRRGTGDFTLEVKELTTILSITVIYSSLIAWIQFLRQTSIGGIFWWLGERTFNAGAPGIAQVVLNGQLFLRPYATFSHPNVLGGYLAVVLPLLMQNAKCKMQFSTRQLAGRKLATQVASNDKSKFKNILRVLAILLGITALFISFSRAAWIVGGLGIAATTLLSCFKTLRPEGQEGRRRLRGKDYLVLVALLLCYFVALFFIGRQRLVQLKADTESIRLRRELNNVALAMIKKHPLTGVGLNNFIPSLFHFKKGLSFKELQPAHNIFLLIGAETGLVGLGAFLWLIFKAYQKIISKSKFLISKQIPNPKSQIPKFLIIRSLDIWDYLGQLVIRSIRNFTQGSLSPLFISLTSILLLGLFDHYFYTLQQGEFLLVLVLGMVLGLE